MRRGAERECGGSGRPDGGRFPVSAGSRSSGGNGQREPPARPSCGRPSRHDPGRGSLERAFAGDARPAARTPWASAPSPGSCDPCRRQRAGPARGSRTVALTAAAVRGRSSSGFPSMSETASNLRDFLIYRRREHCYGNYG